MNLIDKIKEYVNSIIDMNEAQLDEEGPLLVALKINELINIYEPNPTKTATEIATKYIKGQHDALTENQEIKDLASEIEAYKNQPPKPRSMLNLPEKGISFNVLIKDDFHQNPWWQIGKQSTYIDGVISEGSRYKKSENVFKDSYTRIILGWLPLPNPNKIKINENS